MDEKKGNLAKFFGVTSRMGWFLVFLAAAALLINWLIVIVFLVTRPGELGFLRLHYTAALGVDWVAEWWKFFIYPGAGLAAFFINGFFSGILTKKHRLFGSLLLGATAVIELFLTIGAIMVALLNR
jgi:hypothetical protein